MTALALPVQAESIDAATTIGVATLAVSDAQHALMFYKELLGLKVLDRADEQIVLGAGGVPLLRLLVQSGLAPRPRHTAGLYHVAFLLPDRVALAHVLQRLLLTRFPFGASDHFVSEALYLSDPDENGLEIYCDRPRASWNWRANGLVDMATRPLDLADVLAELSPASSTWHGMPAGTRIGHMHLQVSDLHTAEAFYHGVLGFDVTQRLPGVLFLSAGGYHHHFGMNTWHSLGASAAPATAAGLRSFVIELPHAEALAHVQQRIRAAGLPMQEQPHGVVVRDPWEHELLLAVTPVANVYQC
jgi:catechol 2,3-dioxygenase